LKNRHEFAIADNGSRGCQGCCHLGRMVSEVVINLYPATLAVKLESALGAAECFDCPKSRLRLKTKANKHG
jgi:hypothetical protein